MLRSKKVFCAHLAIIIPVFLVHATALAKEKPSNQGPGAMVRAGLSAVLNPQPRMRSGSGPVSQSSDPVSPGRPAAPAVPQTQVSPPAPSRSNQSIFQGIVDRIAGNLQPRPDRPVEPPSKGPAVRPTSPVTTDTVRGVQRPSDVVKVVAGRLEATLNPRPARDVTAPAKPRPSQGGRDEGRVDKVPETSNNGPNNRNTPAPQVQPDRRARPLGPVSRPDHSQQGQGPSTGRRDQVHRQQGTVGIVHVPAVVVHKDPPSREYTRPRYVFVSHDLHGRPSHRIIRPSFRVGVWYSRGRDRCIGFVYPFYHRKYVFVSLDGWWPWDCMAVRYYWYGCHPYWWYGCWPVPVEVCGNTYNYYTYNYYSKDQTTSGQIGQQKTIYGIPEEQLSPKQPDQQAPNPPTQADTWFDAAVAAFEQGRFAEAAEAFRQAGQAQMDDKIIPFAYAQALFADGRYKEAAEALRRALRGGPDSKGILYPRGLYKDDQVLYDQIDRLAGYAKDSPNDMDLQLLLGYQLLGIGQAGQAIGPLEKAKEDPCSAEAAQKLLSLAISIEQALEEEPQQAETTQEAQ